MKTFLAHGAGSPGNRGPAGTAHNAGFTLIEIMVATAIASIMIVMMYATYRSIFNSIMRSTGHAEFYENVNLAISKIDQDISNTYFDKKNKDIRFICEDDGGNSSMTFVSVNHTDTNISGSLNMPNRESDVKEIGYFLRPDKNTAGLFYLIKREKFNYWEEDTVSDGTENILLPNVAGLKFEFHRGQQWEENWDSQQNNLIPRAVRTTLLVKNYQAQEEQFQFVSLVNVREFR
ncbi:MAG: prepilin-type N-terminal cleavage/methylation domain-containing protein [Spirochaetes bacterium]|nr:prepilin-type N-terminal cleavage/methylation domain-containing protein [Spirochaetota bacterium]